MVFEPVPSYAEDIKKRFDGNDKVKVFDYGLEKCDSSETLFMHDDGSSSYKDYESDNVITVHYRAVDEFIREQGIDNIDLMKINIEGGEYDLLEAMISKDLIRIVDNFQIQFHNIKSIDAKNRMSAIIKELEKTHRLTWSYRPFVWENWERKK